MRNDIYSVASETAWDTKLSIIRACIDFALEHESRLLTHSHSQSLQELVTTTILGELPHGIVVEAGAFDGVTYSNTLVISASSSACIVLVEPSPNQFGKLVKSRSSQNAILIQAALSSASGSAQLNQVTQEPLFATISLNDIYDGNSEKRKKNSDIVHVKTQTLENIIKTRSKDGLIDLLFLDVEGHEYEALVGMGECNFKVGVIEVNNPLHSRKVADFLANRGYEVFSYPFAQNEVLAVYPSVFQCSKIRQYLEIFRYGYLSY